jgi:hypothetical protein
MCVYQNMIVPYTPGIMCKILIDNGCSLDFCMRSIFGSAWCPLEPDKSQSLPEYDQIVQKLKSLEIEEGEIVER